MKEIKIPQTKNEAFAQLDEMLSDKGKTGTGIMID